MTLTDQIYAEVTDKILKELEKGTAPWRKTWSGGAPKNLVSGKNYRGINAFLLAIQGDEYFLTYKQCQELGGKVKAGSKGSRVIYWNMVSRETDAGELKNIPFLKYYTVFGASQCEGLKLPERSAKVSDEEKIEAAETIIKGYFGPSVSFGGDRAFYRPSTDSVQMPEKTSFDSIGDFYTVFFHELGHSTGHERRLNREGVTAVHNFGDALYSKEELVAEMTAAFLAGKCGIENTMKNSASYIDGWMRALKNSKNSKLVIQAAAQAQKAADFILGTKFED